MELFESKHFRRAVWLLLIFLIIYVGEKISFVFYPFIVFFRVFFVPVSFAIVFYYIFVPVIDWLEKKRIKRTWGVILFFLLLVVSVILVLLIFGASFENQLVKLAEYVPSFTDYVKETFQRVREHPIFARFQDSDFVAVERLSEYLSLVFSTFFDTIGSDISRLVSFLSNTIVGFVLLPVFLFYMLIEARDLRKKIVSFLPSGIQEKTNKILFEIDSGLNAFIKGRVIVCFFLAVLSFIGYVVIGLEAPLVLATIVFFTNFIPYLGPVLGAIPALLIGLIMSFSTFIKVLILVVAVQQIEGVFVSPQVMSKKLSIHPVIVIGTVMLGGHFAGILGVLFAVPFYLILRVLAVNLLPEKYGEKIRK